MTILVWILAAWLIFPLITLDKVDMSNVIHYLYRTALGLTLLIILFGKTMFDIIFPWVHDRKIPALNAVLLTLYAIGLGAGIAFLVVRLAMLYMKSRSSSGVVF